MIIRKSITGGVLVLLAITSLGVGSANAGNASITAAECRAAGGQAVRDDNNIVHPREPREGDSNDAWCRNPGKKYDGWVIVH